ncbi:MAG: nickel pincer cofactor biosynthesis protein LarC [Vicinamibacteria bacterium]
MSRLLYFDCAQGASGDMLMGALVDLGLPLASLEAELRKLPLPGWRLESRRVMRCGLQATKVDVVIEGHEHAHRGLAEIASILGAAGLDPADERRALSLFERLAVAEAAVHGVPVERVHFHEVGAVDSILDVVGAVVGLRWLGAERFVASPLNVGTGTVTMSHGTFPVPPPATARLVAGAPVFGAGKGEKLTPTGALLVTGYATEFGPLPLMKVEATGYGAGTREDPDAPNVLRLIVGDAPATAAQAGPRAAAGPDADAGERVLVLECELDDMSPQLVGPLYEQLLAASALDVYVTPIQMKKGRPGLLLSVLARPADRDALEGILFRETTTLGVRRSEWQRTALERRSVTVETAYGAIAIKLGLRAGAVVNAQPEFEECRRAAQAHAVPLKEVMAAALAAWRARGE